jgi:hypothetical protein
MILVRISCDEAHELLERQIGDYFPTEAQQADWYASADGRRLGTVMPSGFQWRFVLLRRDDNAEYYAIASGKRTTQDEAFHALDYESAAG